MDEIGIGFGEGRDDVERLLGNLMSWLALIVWPQMGYGSGACSFVLDANHKEVKACLRAQSALICPGCVLSCSQLYFMSDVLVVECSTGLLTT